LFKITPSPVLNEPQLIADRPNPKRGAAPFLADSAQNIKNGATVRIVIGYIIQLVIGSLD
jgi:hypothetical protein